MTVLTNDLLESFGRAHHGRAHRRDDAARDLHVRGVLRFRAQAVFAHEWLCVGRESRIADVGDYSTSVNGEPIIVARAKDGSVRAFSAICQHRHAGRRRRRQLHEVHVPVPPVELRPDRLLGAPAMERTVDFDKKRSRCRR